MLRFKRKPLAVIASRCCTLATCTSLHTYHDICCRCANITVEHHRSRFTLVNGFAVYLRFERRNGIFTNGIFTTAILCIFIEFLMLNLSRYFYEKKERERIIYYYRCHLCVDVIKDYHVT